MERVGNRVDRFLSNVVRVAYVIGLGLAFISYFSSTFVDSPEISWGLGIALGCAFIIHEFLVQRRIISLWNKLSRLRKDVEERKHLRNQLLLNLGMGVVVFAADVFFGWMYYSHLLLGTNVLDPSIEAWLRPAILGVLFLMSSMLSPVEDDAAQILAEMHGDMVLKLTKATRKQFNERIDRAVDEGRNLAGVAADLMQLAGDEQRAFLMDHMDASIQKAAPGMVPVRGVKMSNVNSLPAPKKSGVKANRVSTQPSAYIDTTIEQPEVSRKDARPVLKLSTQKRVERYIKSHPDASDAMVAKALGVSRNTVAKYRPSEQNLSTSSMLNGTDD